MAFNEDSSASGHDEPWIQWFCGLKGHEMFCEVERSYIEDGFNLYGLRACVPNFSDCLDLILDRIGPDDSDDSHLTQSACTLYGLIHARYIITAHGLDAMYNKYAAKELGTCPLIQCAGQPVLPVGLKDDMGADTVKLFCPKCNQVYHPPPIRSRAGNASGVDGAAFGTTFPHLFLMTFSNLTPDPLPTEAVYIPRVFGFRVHKTARQRVNNNNNNINNNAVANIAPLLPPPQPAPVVVNADAVADMPVAIQPDTNYDNNANINGMSNNNSNVISNNNNNNVPIPGGSYTAASAGTATNNDKLPGLGPAGAAKAGENFDEGEESGKSPMVEGAEDNSNANANSNNNNNDNDSKKNEDTSSKNSSRARRKRKSSNSNNDNSSNNNNNDSSKKDSNGSNPTLLIESSAKRRKRSGTPS